MSVEPFEQFVQQRTAASVYPWYAKATEQEIDAHPVAPQIWAQIGEHVSDDGHRYRLVSHDFGNIVSAHYTGKSGQAQPRSAGYLQWFGKRRGPDDEHGGTIHKVFVSEAHRRRGLASAMLDFARQQHPDHDIRHSNVLSDDGRAWSEKKASRPMPTPMSFEAMFALATEGDGEQHPLITEHLAKFGVAHTCLGRRLDGHRRTAAGDSEIHQSGEFGPLPHDEQEKRLADTKMWVPHKSFAPSRNAVSGARAYASTLGLADPHATGYEHIMTSPDLLRETGRAYESLPHFDSGAVPHFERMRDEVRAQHDFMTHRMGIKTEAVDHDPYPSVHDMVRDVVNNRRIKVLSTKVTGGHDFLSDDDNDKFRAVHDVFGHAATGRAFDAHGEEAAWLAHSRMFTPQARAAMSSETRGQNAALHLNGSFQDQKTAILPSHLWNDEATKMHTSGLQRDAITIEGQVMRYTGYDTDPARHGWTSGLRTSYVVDGRIYSANAPMSFEAFFKEATVHVMHDQGGTLCGADISQKKPNQAGFEGTCPDCRDLMEEGKPYSSKSDMHPYGWKDVLGSRKVAHDSGDGETIYHCPFCGSGQVLARSDRTIECQFCHICFTVQVQPQYSAFPQTVNGVPVDVPGMPGQIGEDPTGAGDMPPGADPTAPPGADPTAPPGADQGAPPDPDADGDDDSSDDGDSDDDKGNPFAKGSSLRTASGSPVSFEDYMAHLAIKHSENRDETLAQVRARRGNQ